MQLTIDC